MVICVAGSATAVLASGSTNSFYVDQTAPASGVVSAPFAWTIGIHNDGTGADEHSITVTDTLPAGLTADSETPDCSDNGDGGTGNDTVECLVTTLPDNSSTSETISATPTTTGTMTNVVNATAKYYGSGGVTDEQTLTAPTSTLTTPVSDQPTGTTTTTTTSTPPPPPPPPTTTTAPPGPPLASAQLAPIGGSSQGGTHLLIEGSDFKRTTSVWIGAQQITDFHVDSDNQISLLTPPHSDGAEPVTVFTPSATYTATFTYFDDPDVYELQPSNLPACCGGTLFIHGIALEHVIGVQVNGQSVPIVGRGQGGLADDGWGWIGVNVPPGHGSVPLTVTAPTGSDTVSLPYGSAPELDDIQPEAGPSAGGYTATLIGSNFTPAMKATFGSQTVGVTVLSPTRAQVTVPPGSGRETVAVSAPDGSSQLPFPFDYEPSPCENSSNCSFSAWAEADSVAKGPNPPSASKHDQQPNSGAGTCIFSTHLFGCPLGKGPAKAQTSALVSGASAAANSSAQPFGAAISLLTNTAKGGKGTADGGTESTDSWVITPIPDKPIQAEVVVSFAANTAIGTLGVSNGSVSGDWQASFQGNTLKGSVTRNVAYDKDSHALTALESEQTWLNGNPLPPSPSYVLPEVLNPKQWNEIWVSSYLDGIAEASGAEGTADYSATLDPVVIPLTPGYQIKTRAPGRLAHTAIIAALSRAWARPGTQVRLMGAGFGRRKGSVSILPAGARRATRVTVLRWSATGVLVRLPRHARLGEAWISVKPAHATKSNVVPLVIAHGQPPTILHLSRRSGRAGQKVRIRGLALTTLRWVKFGGRKARIRSVHGGLVATVPRGHGTVAVTVATRAGVSMPNVNAVFRYR